MKCGVGTFAEVYMCTLQSTGKIVAVKKIKQNKTYKSRELQIHKEMHHQNIVRLRHAYFVDAQRNKQTDAAPDQWWGSGDKKDKKKDKSPKRKGKGKKGQEEQPEALLHIVMDYIPSNVYRV